MADLTVLSLLSPLPAHPSFSRPSFYNYNARASSSKVHLPSSEKVRPRLAQIRVTKEANDESNDSDDSETPTASSARPPSSPMYDSPQQEYLNIVSPTPRVASSSSSARRPTHRPSRSQSAPPERIHFTPAGNLTPRAQTDAGSPYMVSPGAGEQFPLTRQRRGYSTYNAPPTAWGYSSHGPGALVKPLPPLHRPTTFWRRTPRSGVTSSSYSPSTHLIRRSTFIAAGLSFDRPMYDVSAQGVESRIVNDAAAAKVTGSFWEVIV
ncbi:hypothetical protein C8J56DRAFT_898542 [Mycena floridula]|nr:hypothetical protein C8J56DRAFT_898542 [Mycena floridula]